MQQRISPKEQELLRYYQIVKEKTSDGYGLGVEDMEEEIGYDLRTLPSHGIALKITLSKDINSFTKEISQ